MLVIELILLILMVVWIIKDHKAVMQELKAMRANALLSENGSQVRIK